MEWPLEPNATRTDQFLLGDDILVAPIDPFAHGGKNGSWNCNRDVWLPPGSWHDAFSGAVLEGNRTISRMNVPLDQMPLYYREGGLVVLSNVLQNGFVVDAWPLSDPAAPRTVRSNGNSTLMELTHGMSPSVHVGPSKLSWVVRFHLQTAFAAEARNAFVVTVNGAPISTDTCVQGTMPCVDVLLAAGSATPFQGAGARPAVGHIVEVHLPESSSAHHVALLPNLDLIV